MPTTGERLEWRRIALYNEAREPFRVQRDIGCHVRRRFRRPNPPVSRRLNMKGFLIRGLITALGLWVASALLAGVHSSWFLAVLGAGLLLGLVNGIIRPLIVILTLPV